MPTLLQIDSSPRAASVSSRLTAAFVERWKQRHPAGTVIHRNTSIDRIPYLGEAEVDAWFVASQDLTREQKKAQAFSDQLVDELLAADPIVLGVPMWNLSIPASIKAWIDMIVREGRTFAFTEDGVAGLVPAGKRVYVFCARGGRYPAGSPLAALDHLEPYLRTIFGCIGLTEIQFIYADNQSEEPEAAAGGFARAEVELMRLAR